MIKRLTGFILFLTMFKVMQLHIFLRKFKAFVICLMAFLAAAKSISAELQNIFRLSETSRVAFTQPSEAARRPAL